MNSKHLKSDYHYLLLRDQKNELTKKRQQIKQIVKGQISSEKLLGWKKLHPKEQNQLLMSTMKKIRSTQWAKQAMQKIKKKLVDNAKQLYEFQSQINYFLVESLRESLYAPTATTPPEDYANLQRFYKVRLNKEIKRVLWQKILVNQDTKQKFYTFDHQVAPYNLTDQLSINLIRISQQNDIVVKENQKDVSLRLLQFIVKKHNKIPNKSEQSLCLCIVDLYSHLTPSKMYILGSVYVGLLELANSYYEPNVQKRMEQLLSVFEIVDKDSFDLIKNSYLNEQKHMALMNQCFEHFRLSLGCLYFPLSASQFMVDQLLIKKHNKLDIYAFFVMMIMIMSDELEDQKNQRKLLTQVIYSQNTKRIIKIQDVLDAFKVIYQRVPYDLVDPDVQVVVGQNELDKNQLLQEMQKYDSAPKKKESPKLVSIPEDELKNFVIYENKPKKLSDFMNKE